MSNKEFWSHLRTQPSAQAEPRRSMSGATGWRGSLLRHREEPLATWRSRGQHGVRCHPRNPRACFVEDSLSRTPTRRGDDSALGFACLPSPPALSQTEYSSGCLTSVGWEREPKPSKELKKSGSEVALNPRAEARSNAKEKPPLTTDH